MIAVPRQEDQHADHCAAWFFLADALDRRPPRAPGVLDRRDQLHHSLLHLAVRGRGRAARAAARPARRRVGMDAAGADAGRSARQARRRCGATRRRCTSWTGFSTASRASNEVFSRPRPFKVVLPSRRSPCCDRVKRSDRADDRRSPSGSMSLDVFRGLTIAAMILVSTPGSWNAVYTPLDHALWNGWTLDRSGVSVSAVRDGRGGAVRARRAGAARRAASARTSLRRALVLFALGLVLNAIETPPPLQLGDVPDSRRAAADRDRVPGGGVADRTRSLRVQIASRSAALAGYWAAADAGAGARRRRRRADAGGRISRRSSIARCSAGTC